MIDCEALHSQYSNTHTPTNTTQPRENIISMMTMAKPNSNAWLPFVALLLWSIQNNNGISAAMQQQQQQQQQQQEASPPCRLWLAESTLYRGALGVFSGVSVSEGESVAEAETNIPIYDINDNEWSPWKDIFWSDSEKLEPDILLQNHYKTYSFLAGLGAALPCSKSLQTVRVVKQRDDDDNHNNNHNNGDEVEEISTVHRSTHPTTGSFGDRHPMEFVATTDIIAGQELFLNCDDFGDDRISNSTNPDRPKTNFWKPPSILKTNGVCIDGITVGPSTIEGAGRGAFTTRAIQSGETITSSPTIFFDKSQMEIVTQTYDTKLGKMQYTENVTSYQLLLNYCYGLKNNSNVLLLPYGPGINFINHGSSSSSSSANNNSNDNNEQEANAILDWSEAPLSHEDLLELTAADILIEERRRILVDVVALRDLELGEEIFIDYGNAWSEAWEEHVQQWTAAVAADESHDYISAAEYQRRHTRTYIRTLEEQDADPYPGNILTACMFQELEEILERNDYGPESKEDYTYVKGNYGSCLRPCEVVTRQEEDTESIFYIVRVKEVTNTFVPDHCRLAPNRNFVVKTPEMAITLVDKEYTSNQFLETAFRHEIAIPGDMFPHQWLTLDPYPTGDFAVPEDMKPGQLEKIRWDETGNVVTENAYLLGLNPKLRTQLLKYCDKMGITEMFRELTYRGNALSKGSHANKQFQGLHWYIQRPEGHWNSNMHWISPLNAEANDNYLQALSAAGFDDVLKVVGEQLGLKSLAAYHVTFIGVSECNEGYIHYDVSETGARVFNVIIPLILANETRPELDLRDDKREEATSSTSPRPVGRLRYQYDVASLMGDDAYHATSAVDYRTQKEMRMAATVYIADIGEDNIDAILADYTQRYPPKDKPEILLGMAGLHWRKDDPSARLPEPVRGHVLLSS